MVIYFEYILYLILAQIHQKDYYKVLGISKTASQKDVKKAYFDVSL